MKVLKRGMPGDGAMYLDPVRLPEIIANAARGFASGVLTPDHLITSTVRCSSHHESTDAAGMQLEDIDWNDPVPGQGHLRLQMNDRVVEAEFWYDEEALERAQGNCPLDEGRLSTMADWIGTHPMIRLAYLGGRPPHVRIALMSLDACCRLWTFEDGTINPTEAAPEPTGYAP